MGIITNIAGSVGSWLMRTSGKAEQVPERVSSVLATTIRPWDEIYGASGQEDYENLVKRYSSWVYACVTTISVGVSQVPLRLYATKSRASQQIRAVTKDISKARKQALYASPQLQNVLAKAVDVVEVLEHPFLRLMDNVNPFMNSTELIWYWIMFQELTGNAYTLITTNALGTPEELWILPSQNVKIVPDDRTFIKGYLYGNDPTTQQKFEPEEIIQMKYPNPANLYYGASPLSAAKVSADTSAAMTAYELNLLLNNAIPPSALSTEQVLTADQMKRLKEEWNAAYRGVSKAGKLAILQGGLKIDPLSLAPREMNYLAGRKASREEIAGVFRVPMSLLTMEDIAAAPAEGQRQGGMTFARYTVRPKCRMIDQKLNERLLPMYDDKLFCAFDDPVGEDRDFRLKEMESHLRTGYSTINQERLLDNQEPVEWGDVPLMPLGMAPLGTEITPTVDGYNGLSFSPSYFGGGEASHNCHAAPKYLDPDSLPNMEMTAILRAIRRTAAGMQADMYERLGGKSWKSAGDMYLPDGRKWQVYLVKQSSPAIVKLITKGGQRGAEQLRLLLDRQRSVKKIPIEFAFDIQNPAIAEFIRGYTYRFSFAVVQETLDQLKETMNEGIMAGESMTDLRKRTQEVFEDMSKYRAEQIARTEAARAVNAGQEMQWQQSGLVAAKEWNGADDMCEFCRAMDAKYGPGTGGLALGLEFAKQGQGIEGADGGNMSTDYGDVAYPPVHPNCLLPGQDIWADNILSVMRARYMGQGVVIILANGAKLAVSANHLLLTTEGWIAAQFVCEGDNLFYCSDFERIISDNPNNHQRPTRIEDIFAAWQMTPGMCSTRVPMASEYLHGDGRFCNGYVDIVRPDGFLRLADKSLGLQHRQQKSFDSGGRNMFPGNGFSTKTLKAMALAADGIMGGRRQSAAFGGRCLAHAQVHGFATAPGFYPQLKEPLTDRISVDTKTLRALLLRYTRLVEPSKVVKVDMYPFSGHIYDLQSESSLYISNGIWSSNCRCDLLPVLKPLE